MPRLKYRTTGFTKLRRALKAMPDETLAEIREALTVSAEKIAADARARVPVDTGTLRDSIEVNVRKDGLSATVGPGAKSRKKAKEAFYGLFVEMGTKGSAEHGIPPMPARPFLGPAFFFNEKPSVKRVRDAVDNAIRKAFAKAGPSTTDTN